LVALRAVPISKDSVPPVSVSWRLPLLFSLSATEPEELAISVTVEFAWALMFSVVALVVGTMIVPEPLCKVNVAVFSKPPPPVAVDMPELANKLMLLEAVSPNVEKAMLPPEDVRLMLAAEIFVAPESVRFEFAETET